MFKSVLLITAIFLGGCDSSPSTLPAIAKRGVLQHQAEEASLLNVNDRLILMASLRKAPGPLVGTRFTFTDAVTGNLLAQYPTTLLCASAQMVGKNIDVVAVEPATRHGNRVWNLVFSPQFKLVSKEVMFYDASHTIYNVSLNGSILAYEVPDDETGHPRIYFRQYQDGEWKQVGTPFDNQGKYASTPTLRKVEGMYYLMYTATAKIKKPFTMFSRKWDYQLFSAIARSPDLRTWEYGGALLAPTLNGSEGICNCDLDMVEYGSRTLFVYQTSWQDGTIDGLGTLHLADYQGSFRELVHTLRWF